MRLTQVGDFGVLALMVLWSPGDYGQSAKMDVWVIERHTVPALIESAQIVDATRQRYMADMSYLFGGERSDDAFKVLGCGIRARENKVGA